MIHNVSGVWTRPLRNLGVLRCARSVLEAEGSEAAPASNCGIDHYFISSYPTHQISNAQRHLLCSSIAMLPVEFAFLCQNACLLLQIKQIFAISAQNVVTNSVVVGVRRIAVDGAWNCPDHEP